MRNSFAGDGCSAQCSVEPGFICTQVLSETSACKIPPQPIIAFAGQDKVIAKEGEAITAAIERLNVVDIECKVTIAVIDASARSFAQELPYGVFPPDFTVSTQTVTFGVNETDKQVLVTMTNDSLWGEMTEYAALLLDGVACGEGSQTAVISNRNNMFRFGIENVNSAPVYTFDERSISITEQQLFVRVVRPSLFSQFDCLVNIVVDQVKCVASFTKGNISSLAACPLVRPDGIPLAIAPRIIDIGKPHNVSFASNLGGCDGVPGSPISVKISWSTDALTASPTFLPTLSPTSSPHLRPHLLF